MRQISMLLGFLFLIVNVTNAERITLTAPHAVSSPQAVSVDWVVKKMDADAKELVVKYRWLDENGQSIISNGSDSRGWKEWICRDIETPGENAGCLAEGSPWACCTGAGAGNCDGYISTCFTDVYSFRVREADVGTPIGVGLRTLMWNKFRNEKLGVSINGAFK